MTKKAKEVMSNITENSIPYTFGQKKFPMKLTFEGVLIAEASSAWKPSNKYKSKIDTEYRTAFLLFRNTDTYFLVKRGESTNPSDLPYEDVYTFTDFTTLRDWILDPEVRQLKLSKPIVELLQEVPQNTEFMTPAEIDAWVACFIEGSNA